MAEVVRVNLHFYGHLSRLAGTSAMQAEVSPVLEKALLQIDKMVGVDLSPLVSRGITLMLNSQDVKKVEHRLLKDGDNLSFIPPITGGLQSGGETDEHCRR